MIMLYVCVSKIYLYPLCIYADITYMCMYIWHRCICMYDTCAYVYV